MRKFRSSKICGEFIIPKTGYSFSVGRNLVIHHVKFEHNRIFDTVKLGFNDHGYIEVTSNNELISTIIWYQMVSLLHKASRL
jgi:hypothetical protein